MQTLAAIPAMAYAAAVTSCRAHRLTHANVGYHLPAVLAKEIATLDVFSEGRLELGIGAGWLVNEYEAMGIPFAPAGERSRCLQETIDLIAPGVRRRQLVDGRGRSSRRAATPASLRRVQRPRPPIMIGGGAPRILRYAGRSRTS